MVLSLEIILILCTFCLVHTYALYPISLNFLTKNKINNTLCFKPNESDLPNVSVLMAVFNEQSVIRTKIESLLQTNYPKGKIQYFIGSDASTDSTDTILAEFQKNNSALHFFRFETRRGKPSIVNDLKRLSTENTSNPDSNILLLTDASVILTPSTIFQLVKHFKNPDIALVDSNQIARNLNIHPGIAEAEKTYIGGEVGLKHKEGLLNFKMLGPLGGCYAMRANFYTNIPEKLLVDDFYLAMRVLEKNGGAISDLDAFCYEPLPSSIGVEYRRKKRISTGNFQNLKTFSHFLWQFNTRAYIFWSHKVLRWLGPFFLLGIISCTLLLNFVGQGSGFHYLLIFELFCFFFVPLLDYCLSELGITSKYLRAWRYLILMNVALFAGFINYTKGVTSGVWQPTPR